ncbi:MAG TPA: nucleotidyl transferase AbiEii/AbiGii toxin family protein [Bacteroidota bacterium]|nr:nucleotidyl transferase AbiEii/AbiGii toxin family protein [Bacteroidota bacterium]
MSKHESRKTEAAHRVLIELMQILGAYRDNMILVGGWVPYLHFGNEHVGSMDVDIALDKDTISDDVYNTIRKILEHHNYKPDVSQPFIFYREVKVDDGAAIKVEIDFLAAEYGGTDKHRRTQLIQDIKARKTRGSDLAFEHPVRLSISGKMPNGAENTVELRVSGIVPFIVMKGMALYDRLKEKDAYDIYFCLMKFPGGGRELAESFRSLINDKLVQEGLSKVRSKFSSIGSMGPVAVADFLGIESGEQRALVIRRAFEVVDEFLNILNVQPFQII